MLVRYEPDPSPIGPDEFQAHLERGSKTALIIPCYKSAEMIGATVEAALKVFPPENIYVVANGNSPTPLDNTEEVIRPYKVNHIWVPIGSKIVAQFVGTYAAYKFQYVLMIDDDCLLPPAFPIVSSRIQPGTKAGLVKCVGYTIKATGPNSSKGTVVQQLQDLEYKLSGMQRKFASTWGSATFAHGAIALWERDFILKCFRHHPGFKISEDWYFGLVCRNLGGRVVMCTSVLVETEVPSGLFVGAGARGGFGEMTVYKQRFYRWNFLFLYRLWNNIDHILFKWDLGVYSIGSKVYTFQEVSRPCGLLRSGMADCLVLLGLECVFVSYDPLFSALGIYRQAIVCGHHDWRRHRHVLCHCHHIQRGKLPCLQPSCSLTRLDADGLAEEEGNGLAQDRLLLLHPVQVCAAADERGLGVLRHVEVCQILFAAAPEHP